MDFDKLKRRLKRAHKSLTNWWNVTGVIILSTILAEPTLIEFLTVNELAYINIIGNVLLRFKTNKDLADK